MEKVMNVDKNELRQYLIKSFLKNKKSIMFTDDTSFFEEGIIDSLGALKLVSDIEQKYGFTAKDEELTPQNLDSVNKLYVYINSKLAKSLIS